MSGLRMTGWGLFPLPGEKKRLAKAEKKADELIDARNELGELEYAIDTRFDFATGGAVVSATVRYSKDVSVLELAEVRRSMISDVLEEAAYVNDEDPLTADDIRWDTEEHRLGDRVHFTATALLKVSGS